MKAPECISLLHEAERCLNDCEVSLRDQDELELVHLDRALDIILTVRSEMDVDYDITLSRYEE
jgi:hypothetical protein